MLLTSEELGMRHLCQIKKKKINLKMQPKMQIKSEWKPVA